MTKQDFDKLFGQYPIYTPKPRDYSEDFGHENGMYNHKCMICGKEFVGHKRRMICKICSYYKNKRRGEE